MSSGRFLGLLLLAGAGTVSACSLSHNGPDGSTGQDTSRVEVADTGPSDVPMDTLPDVSTDILDVPLTERVDVPMDIPIDVPVDVPVDIPVDVPVIPDAGNLPLLEVDFSNSPTGALTVLPEGLTIRRSSTATVQTSNATVAVNIPINTARIGQRTATMDSRGLVIEEERTNIVPNSRALDAATWGGSSNSMLTADYATANDPAGTNLADRVVTNATAGYSAFIQFTAMNTRSFVASEWTRHTSGMANFGWQFGPGGLVTVNGVNTTWRRVFGAINTPNTVWYLTPLDGMNQDFLLDFMQIEEGLWASEAIVTSATTSRRDGEQLTYPTIETLLTGGRLGIDVEVIPKGNRNRYAAPITVWFINSDNRCEIDPATGTITVRINAVDNVTRDTVDWTAFDSVRIYVEAGGGMTTNILTRVNTTRNVPRLATGSNTPLTAITATGPFDLLCQGTTRQWSSWVRTIRAWRPGSNPF